LAKSHRARVGILLSRLTGSEISYTNSRIGQIVQSARGQWRRGKSVPKQAERQPVKGILDHIVTCGEI